MSKDAEEKLEKIKQQLKLSKEQVATLKEMADMTAEELAARKDLVDANVQNNILMAEMMANTGQIAEASKLRAAAEKELMTLQALHMEAINNGKDIEASISQTILDIKAAENSLDEEKKTKLEEELEILKEKKKLHEENRNMLKEHVDNLEQRVSSLKEVTKEYENLSSSGKKVYDQSHKALSQIGVLGLGIVKHQDTMVGKSVMFVKTLMQARKGSDGLKLAFKETFNVANIGASLAQKVLESTIMMFTALDKAGATFAAATGTGREYVAMLESGVKTGNNLGVNFDNMGKSLQGLLENMIGFTHLSKDMQQNLSVQVAQFERLGIASKDAADLMNTFSKTMAASAQESVDLTRKLAMMGSGIGISSKVMIKNFKLAQQTLAVYGKGAIKVFTNLSAAAKAAGVEMSTLLGIAAKFDTFESAADSVGKLNAILGANMSATQVLMQTEDERIETIIQSINMSGESFSQMDRFKQKAIANAAGITDMAEANKIFGMSMSQYRQYSREMKNAETSQTKFQEMVKATIPIQEMFQQMIIEFAPKVAPLLEVVRVILGGVIDFLNLANEKLGSFFPILIGGIGVLMLYMKISAARTAANTAKTMADTVAKLGNAAASMNNAAAKLTEIGALEGQVVAQNSATGSTKVNAAANKSAVGPMLAFGAAVLMVGGAVYLAAEGLSLLVSSFAGLNPGQMEAANSALIGLGVALGVFLVVMGALVYSGIGEIGILIMLGFGAAVLMIGAGIGLAAAGFALIIEAVGVLVGQIGALGSDGVVAAGAFYMMASGIALVAAAAAMSFLAFYLFSKSMAGTAASSVLLALGLVLVGAGLAFVSFLMPGIVEGMSSLASDSLVAAKNFGVMAMGLGVMALGMAALAVAFALPPLGPLGAILALVMLSAGISALMYAIENVDTTKLENVAIVADGISKMIGSGIEVTAVAKVNEDLNELKKTMDSTLMSQIASLNTFQNVESINNVRAQTQADTQIVIKPSDVNVAISTTSEIDGNTFSKATHNAMKQINWGTSNVAQEIVGAGRKQILS